MTGVDGQTSAVLAYPGGAHALVTCTLWALSPRRAWVTGTEGSIEVEAPFYAPPAFTLLRAGAPPAHHVAPPETNRGPGKGLRFEAAEVVRCLREGRTESPRMPLDETISVMETLDEIRERAAASSPG
jgi:predicted dehydrogenase